jgi:chaperonin GroEL
MLGNSIGGNILRIALQAPLKQIIENCEGKESIHLEIGGTTGYDSKSGKIVDLSLMGIYDPAVVTKNAITNALSVVATILTTKSVITKPR